MEADNPAFQRLERLGDELSGTKIMEPRYQEKYLRLLKKPPEDNIKITWKQVDEGSGGGKVKPIEAGDDVNVSNKFEVNIDADDILDLSLIHI